MENTNIIWANAGDKVKLNNGKIYEFVKLKRTKFVGKLDGALYDIPVQAFVEIVEKAPPKKIDASYKKLKEGELFFINKNDTAVVFRFVEFKNGRIFAINPIDGGKTRIDVGLYGGKLSKLKG